jgi:hypothetical protein
VEQSTPKKRQGLSALKRRGLASLEGLKSRSDGVRVSAVIAVALTVGLLVWLLLIKGDDNSPETTTEPAAGAETVKVVPESGLLGALKGVGYPIYWAGPRVGVEYEVIRRTRENRTYVRYIPKGEEPESEKHFLTVGSYQISRAFETLRELGQQPNAILLKVPGGGEAYAESRHRTNVYLAFPGVGTEIEVYDPRPGNAMRLIRSGAIVPIG